MKPLHPKPGKTALLHELHVHQAELELQNQELRESQQALEASRALYADLFDFAPIGYLTLDPNVSVAEMNLAAAALLGWPRERAVGKPFRALARCDPPDAMSDHVRLCIARGGSTRAELHVVRRSDHAELSVEVLSVPIRSPEGAVLGVRTAIIDHTESRQAERERQAAVEREVIEAHARHAAEQASRMKDEFLGVVSHELRTPLNAILGWAHMLTAAHSPDPAKTAHGLEVILRNAQSQHRLVEDLLDVSRIVTGKLRIEMPGPAHLAAIVRAGMDSVQHVASARRVTLVLHLRSDPRVMADVERLEQVTRNLLSNAVKFAPQGGKVDVTVDAHDELARLSVRDNGCGIEQAELPRLFERFRQVDGSPSRLHGGLGLGLAIVRHIVELHGGRTWGESEGIGHGATFHVELPIALHPVGPTIRPPDGPVFDQPLSLAGVRVLIVEDDDDARLLAGMLLESAGASVAAAGTVAQGLAAFARHTPDVVVSDIGMPGQDGFSLLRQIRALPSPACAVPVVALTAYARPEDVETLKAVGFDDHLAKPATPSELIERVGRLARER